jgi:adenylate cyclase
MAAALLMPWPPRLGQALLLAATITHAGLGLASLASSHSLAMSRTDWVQLLLGLATPPLLVNHVVGLAVASDLLDRFSPDYGYVLAVEARLATPGADRIPILFAIPILALLGLAHAGEAVLARLATDAAWRALIEQNLRVLQEMGYRLNVIER